jgi:hypothetical protein
MGNSGAGSTAGQSKTPVSDAADKLCIQAKADLVILAGSLYDSLDYDLYARIAKNRRSDNVLLLMATFGGSPHVAYKISRMLQKGFKKFTVVIDAYCKSGGTLLAMGAHDLVMSKRSELGPLDIQIGELEDKQSKSGLAPVQALKILQEQVAESYIRVFEALNDSLQIQAKSAIATADHIISSLFAEIYEQLEPIKLAEYERAMTIMKEYGQRLSDGSRNLKEGSLDKLLKEYPDHSFVIDRYEADDLFNRVRDPSDLEQELLVHLNGVFAQNIGKKAAYLEYISCPQTSAAGGVDDGKSGQQTHNRDAEGGDFVPTGPIGGDGQASTKGEVQETASAAASYRT